MAVAMDRHGAGLHRNADSAATTGSIGRATARATRTVGRWCCSVSTKQVGGIEIIVTHDLRHRDAQLVSSEPAFFDIRVGCQ